MMDSFMTGFIHLFTLFWGFTSPLSMPFGQSNPPFSAELDISGDMPRTIK